MLKRRRKLLLIAIGILVSAVAAAYFLHGMRGQWAEMGKAFAQANYLYVIPSVALLAVTYVLRVLRWRVFLNPIKAVPYPTITSATCIGFMSTCVLPLRAGEVIRPYVLHRKSGISFGHAAGTAPGLERVFDMTGVCLLLLLTWLALCAHAASANRTDDPNAQAAASANRPLSRSAPEVAGFAQDVSGKGTCLAVMVAIGLACLATAAFFPSLTLRAAGRVLSILPASWNRALMGIVRSVVEALAFLKSPGRVALAMLLSFGIWFLYPVSTYCLARAFELNLPFAGSLVVQTVVTAAVVAPQAPGFFGPFQAAAKKGVELFGVSRGNAGAFAVMMWAIHVIPITVVGLAFLRREGFSLKRLAQASERAAEQPLQQT